MAVRQLPDGRWICYYRIVGSDGISRQKRDYFGRGPEAEAKARARNSELNITPRRPGKKTIKGPTFGVLAERYGDARNFSYNSRLMLSYRLNANILPVFENMPAIKITHEDLDEYVKMRRTKIWKKGKKEIEGVRYSTIRREISDIKAILNWAVSRRPALIKFNPVQSYKPPKEDNAVIMPPTAEETGRILAAASQHLTRAILLSYYLGLRPGAVELLSLDWLQVDWTSKRILITSAHKGGPQKRLVPIHEDLLSILRTWHEDDKKPETGPIIHYHGKAIKKLRKSWTGALTRAGITRRIRPYDLRHHFITQALEQGADMKALSEVVGSRPETLMHHYQHVTTDLHRRTVAKIPRLTTSPQGKQPKKK